MDSLRKNTLKLWILVGLALSIFLTAGTCYLLFPTGGEINYEGVAKVIIILLFSWIIGVGFPIYLILKTKDEKR